MKSIFLFVFFRSADENMNLASLEEFKANAPESFRTEAIMKNPHKLHLSRLNWEMLERKTLVFFVNFFGVVAKICLFLYIRESD